MQASLAPPGFVDAPAPEKEAGARLNNRSSASMMEENRFYMILLVHISQKVKLQKELEIFLKEMMQVLKTI